MRYTLVTLFFAASVQAQVAQWIQCPLNGHYYALLAATTWAQAEQFAVTIGGHLATVRSAAENDWLITTFASSVPDDTRIWIGLTDGAVEGIWTWASGESTTFSSWGLFEPDNSGDQDYGALWRIPAGVGGGWGWADAGNGDVFAAIVELPQLQVASWGAFGDGCPGPNGLVPTLDGVVGEPPQFGSTARMVVTNLPTQVTVPIFVVGLSNSVASGSSPYPLPLDLGNLGWPGCQQLVSVDATTFAITTVGHADFSLPIPGASTLVGFEFFVQAIVLYHPTGVAVSNGLVGTVGY